MTTANTSASADKSNLESISGDDIPILADIPILHDANDSLPILFSNHMAITHNEHEVFFCFYQVNPPVVETSEKLQKVMSEGIKALLVARIAIPCSRYSSFLKSINAVSETMKNLGLVK